MLPALTLALILLAVVALALLLAYATSRPQSDNGLVHECDRQPIRRYTANGRQ